MIPAKLLINTNIYGLDGENYLWYRLVYDGLDLAIEACNHDFIGTISDALDHEINDNGTDIIMPDRRWSSDVGGDTWLRFGLENGIAPGVPFCVRVSEPSYSKSWTDCGYEYDMDIDWEVVHVAPCRNPAHLWDKTLKWIQDARAYVRERRRKLAELQRTDRAAMAIRREWYFSDGYYDEMSMPHGVRLTLGSLHTHLDRKPQPGWGLHGFTSGESKDGVYEEAFANLRQNLVKGGFADLADEAFLRSLRKIDR